MSVTISDIMKLPSLRGAKIVAGLAGIHLIVSGISVLEAMDEEQLGFEFSAVSSHFAQEIMVTAFMATKDDVSQQCHTIQRLSKEGSVAIILFYVGRVLPCIDQRVIDLVDLLGMPLIVMPEGQLELRYGDVISDVMEAILEDRRANTYFASDVIENLSRITGARRTIDTVLAILRDRTHCSLYLFDEAKRILSMAEWPSGRDLPLSALLGSTLPAAAPDELSGDASTHICEMHVNDEVFYLGQEWFQDAQSELALIIVREKEPLAVPWCRQIKHVLKTYLNLWTENYGRVDSRQLINAVLNDEPERMRGIASILKLNTAIYTSVYFFYHKENRHDFSSIKAAKGLLVDALAVHKNTLLLDIFDETIVALTPRNQLNADLQDIVDDLAANGLPFGVVTGDASTTAAVKDTYWLLQNSRAYLPSIYPRKNVFTTGELAFVKQVKEAFDQQMLCDPLKVGIRGQFFTDSQESDLLLTAEVYLLDAELSVTKTAAYLFVHPNTIKYRLKLIEAILGHKLARLPEAFALYHAAALRRLDRSL